MRKTLLLLSILLFLVTFGLLAQAQAQTKIPRMGFLDNGPPRKSRPTLKAVRQRLQELGHIEGKTIHIEWRHGSRKPERLPALAAELVQLNVDVIMVQDKPAVEAAMKATTKIPIVMSVSVDPVKAGFVRDFGRPGGNVTGIYTLFEGTIGKRMELLKEVVPGLSRVVFLTTPGVWENSDWLNQAREVSRPLDLVVQPVEVRGRDDISSAIKTAAQAKGAGIALLKSRAIIRERKLIAALALEHRLPSVDDIFFLGLGGLLGYGVDIRDQLRLAVNYVDKVLKGAKPAELPVVQPMDLRLGVNLKTARKLGLTIPPMILMEADTVIK